MKLKKYLDHLNELVKNNPAALDYDVVTSADDEGNYFVPVIFTPSIGEYSGGEFTPAGEDEGIEANSVCLN